jgi:hypothetical protein
MYQKIFIGFFILLIASTAIAFAGGDGSSDSPYQITTWADLNSIRNDLDAYYVLTTDLGSGDTGYASMDKEAFQEQRIADLGLSMDATREEIREAMHEKRFNEMREKLDLPNATEEEVREAKREQMGEKPFQNKGFRRGRMGPN